jgi:transcriptional regulator GlxA family with amidase domain
MDEPRLTRTQLLGAAAAIGLLGAETANTATEARTMKIALGLWDGIEELDLIGPYEVLSAWAAFSDRSIGVVTVGATTQPITAGHGLRLIPDTTWARLGRPDVLVIGGGGSNAQTEDPRFLAKLRGFSRKGTLMTSVCTGAFVYAAAGILDGKEATTHWSGIAELPSWGKNITVRPDKRFVDAGNVITAAGVSAGIDMALYLIKRLESVERAREVRRYIQYDPAPPV